MAEKTLRVPSNDEPTFWNRDIGLGAAIGFLALPVITLINLISPVINPALAIMTMIGAPVAGAVIGGIAGSSRMEGEAKNGKEASPPTSLNRTAITGMALGGIVGTFLSVAGLFGAVGLGASVDTTKIVLSAISWGSIPVGGMIGAAMGNARMEREYAEAQQYVAQHGEYKGRGQEIAQSIVPQRAYTVTPEEAQLLESRLSQGKSHVERTQGQPNVPVVAVP